jgi:hypothetical protein
VKCSHVEEEVKAFSDSSSARFILIPFRFLSSFLPPSPTFISPFARVLLAEIEKNHAVSARHDSSLPVTTQGEEQHKPASDGHIHVCVVCSENMLAPNTRVQRCGQWVALFG